MNIDGYRLIYQYEPLQDEVNYQPEESLPLDSLSLPPLQLQPKIKGIRDMRLVDLTVHVPSQLMKKSETETAQKPPGRWGTLEFKIYYVVACIVVPIMAWIPIQLSSPSNPNYSKFSHRLSEGWIFSRPVDNSDAQYRSVRNNLWSLTAFFSVFVFGKFIYVRLPGQPNSYTHHLHHLKYKTLLSLIMVLVLHGSSAIKILAILSVNYAIAKSFRGSKFGPLLTWVFNGLVLFANDRYHGYEFGTILPALSFLDQWRGAYPRWYISFNITMLRLVSFNLDYYWACHATETLQVDEPNASMTSKQRLTSHPTNMYSYLAYLSYVLYPPLYLAGPIMTFNDYLWQHRRPLFVTQDATIKYLFRLIISILTMEFILHFMSVVAIKDTKAWTGNSPAQISLIGFWNLIIVWLKLLIPWRFFRLWALMDNIDPPENMVRCMANNYSTLGFWRSWHRSYNLWIIRYIYIPLGGARNVFLNTLLVFTFVALWHDLTFKLLAWGWLVSLFILPEIIATWLLPASRYAKEAWYRPVCAFGAALNILMMMAANLVGFVIGTDGLRFYVEQLFGTNQGLRFLVAAVCCLFVGAQLMFEYRAEETRKGIKRRC